MQLAAPDLAEPPRPARGKRLRPERIEELRRAFRDGLTIYRAARRAGVARETAGRYFHFWRGAPLRPWRAKTHAPWLAPEVALLKRIYPSASPAEIRAALPRHSWHGIKKYANALGLRLAPRGRAPPFEPLRELVALRRRRFISQHALAARLGVHRNQVAKWETGISAPTLQHFVEWCAALSARLIVHDPAQPHATAARMKG